MESAPSALKIEFDGVTTVLGDEPVLHRLRLSVPDGQVTVILGQSGCGKTTLLRHLVGLLPPTGGSVRLDGRDVWSLTSAELVSARGGIAAVVGGSHPFDSWLFSSMNVYENVACVLRRAGATDDEVHATTAPLMREFGLEAFARSFPEEIPAHARRRVLLAQALVSGMPLIVLDDVDTALDSRYTGAIVRAIKSVNEKARATVLITANDLDFAREVAHEVAVLWNGKIVSHGPPDVLLRGVRTGEEFARRFFRTDLAGPLCRDVVEGGLRGGEPARRFFAIDPDLPVWWVVALLLLVIVFVFWSSAGTVFGGP
ncbi:MULTISPECIES: ATP-binding cassette domain-containing protein [Amycolatopsis]|uniref:ATP-binding cassette domain-containing protein n=3 Tax=Amycolatopsis TaxID=1813 RepID=A0A558ABP4_9PSEU|nr:MULTISPECIES: ATP-binding cassette domain-containing protein [Amycolatopsis]PKV92561.1 phospholipid/cholesterol/gamma-HCH transport system ATP-binding protein [Amycolatopsis niigatensis]TVT21667.1 ATP-binding cassette domain-containing protein [Amycolatopsis acidiphila]UIJ59814.1 ATP-binding cassette domain-containing protein [Amycolatopsis acidiphila]GHG63070.1 ABC transporter ATP-binding protein [Amycolatopsis acidiphila]